MTDQRLRLLSVGSSGLPKGLFGLLPAPGDLLIDGFGLEMAPDQIAMVHGAHDSALMGQRWLGWIETSAGAATLSAWPQTDPEGTVTGVTAVLTGVHDQAQPPLPPIGQVLPGAVEHERTEHLLRTLLDRFPGVAARIDPIGRIDAVAGDAITAELADRLRGRSVDDLDGIDDPTRAHLRRLLGHARDGHSTTHRAQLYDRWWQLHLIPLRVHSTVVGVLALLIDISVQVAAEVALRDSQRQFTAFMEHAPAAAFVKDSTGRHIWANRAYLAVYGLDTLDEVIGKTTWDLDPPEVAELNVAEDAATLAGGAARRPPVDQVAGPDGDVRGTGSRFVLPLPDGTVGLAAIWVDTSDLYRARTELTRWRDRYRTLFDQSPVPMTVVDVDGLIMDANPAFCRMLGTPLSALRGQPFTDITDPADMKHEHTQLAALLRGSRPSGSYTAHFVSPADTAPIAAEVTVVRVSDPAEQSDTFVGIIHRSAEPAVARSNARLTDPEAAVLMGRAQGLRNADIATRLGMTRRGVDYHLQNVARKLRCPANTAGLLIARAYHLGILETHTWPPEVSLRHRDMTTAESPPAPPLPTPVSQTPSSPPCPTVFSPQRTEHRMTPTSWLDMTGTRSCANAQ